MVVITVHDGRATRMPSDKKMAVAPVEAPQEMVESGLATLTVIVLAWKDEPWLAGCIDSVLKSSGLEIDLVVVDNGCRPDDLAAVPDHDRFRLLEPGANLGFAGGCNLGVSVATGEFVALVNSDCLLRPDTLRQLVDEARQPGVGPVMASVRIADTPELVNSSGNPVHLVGLSWAGGLFGNEQRVAPYDVTAASGACLVLQRSVWDRLGGFDPEYFAYVEDTELSLRAWQQGLTPRCVPTAVALHHYEFSRNDTKMYLLERNRLMMVATLWSARALVVLSPLLAGVEMVLICYAAREGWAGQKVRGWLWLWSNRAHLQQRRAEVQAQRTQSDAEWMRHLTPDLDDQVMGSSALTWFANGLVRIYWFVARRLI